MKTNQKILIIGLSGSMGKLTAERINELGLSLVSFGIGAPEDNGKIVTIKWGNEKIQDYSIIDFNHIDEIQLDIIKKEKPIIIDFTHKNVVKNNWEQYYKGWGCPVIFGTIGIKKSDIIGNKAPIIIGSPNLSPEIVEVLRAFSSLEEGSLKNFTFSISESHQEPKKEISGTAVRIEEYSKKAGAKENSPIEVIRDPQIQKQMGITEEYLNGHGWHTYKFFVDGHDLEHVNDLSETLSKLFYRITKSKLNTEKKNGKITNRWTNQTKTLEVIFEIKVENSEITFTHNVNGRVPYIDGLFETVMPAIQKMIENKSIEVKDMFDL